MFRPKSGYTGTDIGRYAQPGSNGLTFDPQGSRPVRVGNSAWTQRQLDVYGELLSAAQRAGWRGPGGHGDI